MEKVFLVLFLSSIILVSVSARSTYYPNKTEDPCPGRQVCKSGTQLLPNCNDCQRYFRCLWQRRINVECPHGTFFNVHTLSCDYSSDQCGSRPIRNYGGNSTNSNANNYVNYYYNLINNKDQNQNNNNRNRPVEPPTAMSYGGYTAVTYNLSNPARRPRPRQPKEPFVEPYFDTNFLKEKYPRDDDKNVVYQPSDDVNNSKSSYYDIYNDLLTSDSGVTFSTSQYHEQERIY